MWGMGVEVGAGAGAGAGLGARTSMWLAVGRLAIAELGSNCFIIDSQYFEPNLKFKIYFV